MAQGDAYFAWVEADEAFDPVVHRRLDEEVESWDLTGDEDSFAVLTMTVAPPEGGLLKSTRKVWGLLSVELSDGSVTLLARGKVDSFPLGGDPYSATLKFKCAPLDWEAAQLTVLLPTRSQAHFDPVLVSPESLADPTEILDGQSRVIAFHPATHVCELHDILGVDLPTWDIGLEWFDDTLEAQISEAPITAVVVKVTAQWTQKASGVINVTDEIDDAFDGLGPNTISPEDFENRWPKSGDGVANNNGYTVKNSSLKRIYPQNDVLRPLLAPVFQGSSDIYDYINDAHKLTNPVPRDVLPPFDRAWYDASLSLAWETEQSRSEIITMTLRSGVQDTSLGNGGTRTIDLTCQDVTIDQITPAWKPNINYAAGDLVKKNGFNWTRINPGVSKASWGEDFATYDMSTIPPTLQQNWLRQAVDQSPIGGIGKASYFTTNRGMQTLLAGLMKGRAALADAMRCVEIKVSVPLYSAIEAGIWVGMNVTLGLPDGRLAIEGNTVTGKVVAYSLKSSASEDIADITIKCACGSGNVSTGSGALWASLTGETWDRIVVPDLSNLEYEEMLTGGVIRARVNNDAPEQISFIDARDYDPSAGRTDKDETDPKKLIREVPTEISFDLIPLGSDDEMVVEFEFTAPGRFDGPRQVDFGGA